MNPSKISVIGLAICSGLVCVVWLAALVSPWYQTNAVQTVAAGLNIGVENTTTDFLCWVDGTCLFEQDRQFTQDISGDIELDGDNGMLFDANFAMCFIGFFFLLMHFGFTIIKCASPTSPLAKTNIICGCTALLFITISPILFAAGIESNNGVQINSVGGDGFVGDIRNTGTAGVVTTETEFGPQAGWFLAIFTWLFVAIVALWTTIDCIQTGASGTEADE
eukprot:TRINITY_DN39497_c0_g1_i1.p1 TRINITY_DN39497_c0_g1~~TRINITY_DN39497_c0_g1_i1.p1  ORF type:complete len:221 (-),score=32.92 TRINITY_DN39497_c0_g1_i1:101-763(-)